jgi:hypothetical protein
VFATHLHQLLALPWPPALQRCRMEVLPAQAPASPAEAALQALGLPLYRPTWRMVPGDCTISLALQVGLLGAGCLGAGCLGLAGARAASALVCWGPAVCTCAELQGHELTSRACLGCLLCRWLRSLGCRSR